MRSFVNVAIVLAVTALNGCFTPAIAGAEDCREVCVRWERVCVNTGKEGNNEKCHQECAETTTVCKKTCHPECVDWDEVCTPSGKEGNDETCRNVCKRTEQVCD